MEVSHPVQERVLNSADKGVVLLKPLSFGYKITKRCLDILVSGVLLLILFPIIIVLALVVKLTTKGPVFYASQRVGAGGTPFRFIKFRSMYLDADKRLAELQAQNEKDGPIFKMKQDPRITPVGRFMRKYSLDEMPQLMHVFLGQMSMVGPRPPLPREVSQYNERALQRLCIKPGITCYWQVMGRSNLGFDEWIDLDLRYVEEMSFLCDLKILVRTPKAVLGGEGAY